MSRAPQVAVLGGPNSAGKSTVAPDLLRNALGLKEFVNADLIASGLSAFNTRVAVFGVRLTVYQRAKWRHLQELAASAR